MGYQPTVAGGRPGIAAMLAVVLAVLIAPPGMSAEAQEAERGGELRLRSEDRLMVLAPHPDDEVLGCGGVLESGVKLGCAVHVVYFTHGDANEKSFLVYRKHPVVEPSAVRKLGMIRSQEALAACAVLGIQSNAVTFLGYPDGGTLEIWYRHWGSMPPCRSKLTRATAVPYPNALRPGAAYKGEEIVADLKTVIGRFQPTRILVSHPGDHHPDHRSLPLFLMVALWDLSAEVQPQVFPYLVHYKHWPTPHGYHPGASLAPPDSLKTRGAWELFPLPRPVVDMKYLALKKHKTQYEYSGWFLSSFVRENELFDRLDLLRIPSGPGESLLAAHTQAHVETAPEFLLDEQKEFFVGIEQLSMAVAGNEVMLDVDIGRPLPDGAELVISACGWRPDVAYSNMPKLNVRITGKKHEILDQQQKLPSGKAQVDMAPQTSRVKVPLEMLGSPRRVFVSATTELDETPLDTTAWRVVAVEPQTPPSAPK